MLSFLYLPDEFKLLDTDVVWLYSGTPPVQAAIPEVPGVPTIGAVALVEHGRELAYVVRPFTLLEDDRAILGDLDLDHAAAISFSRFF